MVSSTPRPHFTPGRDPVPIIQEAGWDPGPVWTGGKSRPHGGSNPDRPARSQSLYRLSYPAHTSPDTGHIISHYIIFVYYFLRPSIIDFNSTARQAMYVQRNPGTRSWNHCYSGKAICIAYIQRVFVALVIQQAMLMRHFVICVRPALPYFSTLPYKRDDFQKK